MNKWEYRRRVRHNKMSDDIDKPAPVRRGDGRMRIGEYRVHDMLRATYGVGIRAIG